MVSNASGTAEIDGDMPETDAPLISTDFARRRFTDIVFADSHGAFDGFLGCGYLYYSFACSIRSQVSVCIGSGGGFVPELLVQAQRDLKLTPAATYLIDANLPDLGFGSPVQQGGWLDPENSFLDRARDVIVLQMLSKDAAQLFIEQGLTIDYLHIDGDHSIKGVIEDFENYVPLLTERAVVSLHDLRMTSVRKAIEHIQKRFPDWGCLCLEQVGTGTAFMRRTTENAPAALAHDPDRFVDSERQVRFRSSATANRAVAASRVKAKFERWHYLSTAAYRIRYMIAADLIDRPNVTVIEVGGFPNSCIDFLSRSRRLFAFEPYAPKDYVTAIRATAASKAIDIFVVHSSVSDAALEIDNFGEYQLVWMGLDVLADEPTQEAFRKELYGMLKLVGAAKVTVVELSEYVPAGLAWNLIKQCLAPRILREVSIDFNDDPVADEFFVKDGRARRRIVAFRCMAELGAEHTIAIEECADELIALRLREETASASDKTAGIWNFWAASLPSKIGRLKDGLERVATVGIDKPGCLTFGPYLRLRDGRYRLTITYLSSGPSGRARDTWDLCLNVRNVIARGTLPATDDVLAKAEFVFDLSPEQAAQSLEVRTFFVGAGDLTIRRVAIERLSGSDAPTRN